MRPIRVINAGLVVGPARRWKGVVNMIYESMPLYPRIGCDCGRDACVRVPVFGSERRGPGRMPDECACHRVTIENPCRPGERVEVLLGVDDCGNLVVCVQRDVRPSCNHRPPRSCLLPCPPNPCQLNPCLPSPCPPPRPRKDGCRGRLYGSWK